MQQLYKTIFLLSILLFFSLIALSQDQPNQEKEIVMSEQELESFLQKIADLKRERMQRHKEEQLDNLYRSYQLRGERTNNYYYGSGDVNREIERLNKRLDDLATAAQDDTRYRDYPGSANSSEPGEPVYISSPSITPAPSKTILQESVPPTVNIVTKQPPLTGSVGMMLPAPGSGNNKKINALQEQIDALNREINALTHASDHDTTIYHATLVQKDYQDEINNLNAQVAALQVEIEKTRSQADVAETANFSATGLEHYRHIIYFGNNSTQLNLIDRDELKRLAAKVKTHQDRITVLINGFASSNGDAMYNNKLSFARTEAVRIFYLRPVSVREISFPCIMELIDLRNRIGRDERRSVY